MVKVNIKTFGSVNRSAGWNSLAVELAKEKITIEDALRSAPMQDGRALFDLVAREHVLKENYAIFLSGHLLQRPADLQMEIKSGSEIVILDFPFTLGGG